MTDPAARPASLTTRGVVASAVWGVVLTLAAWVAFSVVEEGEKPRLVPLLIVAVLASLRALPREGATNPGRAFIAFAGAVTACALVLRFTVGVA